MTSKDGVRFTTKALEQEAAKLQVGVEKSKNRGLRGLGVA